MTVSDAQEKRRLEDENRRLRELVAKLALELAAVKDALGKSGDGLQAPGGRRVLQGAAHVTPERPGPPARDRLSASFSPTTTSIGTGSPSGARPCSPLPLAISTHLRRGYAALALFRVAHEACIHGKEEQARFRARPRRR